MTKNKALYAWLNQFLPFYRASSVPGDVEMPYGTYEYVSGAFEGGAVSMSVNLFFYTESEAIPDQKEMELSERIGPGGVLIPCDGGYIWLKRGSPWCQSVVYEDEPNIKRRTINLTCEYLTLN